MKRFEALWYTGTWQNEEFHSKEFSTRQALLNFIKKHKNDEGTHGWWGTKRNIDWDVVEDIYVEGVSEYEIAVE